MKETRMYYNLTRIFNGWTLSAPLVVKSKAGNLGWASTRFFPTLREALEYIGENYRLFNEQWGKSFEDLDK